MESIELRSDMGVSNGDLLAALTVRTSQSALIGNDWGRGRAKVVASILFQSGVCFPGLLWIIRNFQLFAHHFKVKFL